jgi:uncharacterized membrane protein
MRLLKLVLNQKELTIKLFFFTILAIGLYLRFYQYFMGGALWEDEAHFALNFMRKGLWDLTMPLDFAQAGPILFLFSVKIVSLIFGYGELTLRAFPLLLAVLTLPLVYFIFLELSGRIVTALFGFLLFSVNLSLIYFSSELKPYSIDVSVYLVLIFLSLSKNNFIEKRRITFLIVAGCLGILLSNIAFIILLCIAGNWTLNWLRKKKHLLWPFG